MLEALRKSITGIMAKALIALLVLSFAVWGIADVITGVSRTSIASVGDKEIGVFEFRRQYQDQVDAVSAQFGRRLTPQQARAFGVEGQVLSTMIGSRAVDTHAEGLKLSITEKAVENDVRSDPLFQEGGNFSPDRLATLLSRVDMTESQFFAARRSDLVRDQLTSSLLENVMPPQALVDIFRTFQEEKRRVRYFIIDPKTAVKLEAPKEEDLRKAYEAAKSQYMSDEYRQVEIMMLTADDAKKRLTITEDQLKERYERDKLSYSVPELRRVLQISFADKATADKARAEMAGGKDFLEVAKASGATESDVDLGQVSKDKLIDPKIAETAFSLEKDKISEAVEGRFATVLLKVTDIKPGNVPTFEEIKDKVRDSIASRLAPGEIRVLHDQVDDNRLAGKALKDIAQLLNLTLKEIPAIARDGNAPDGKPALTSPDQAKILNNAFESDVGVENEVVELADGGYAWVRVLKVEKPKQKPFEDVKSDVEKDWRDKQTRAELAKLAQEYVKKIKDGTAFEEVAKAGGGEVKTTPEFKRVDSLPDLSAGAVTRAFTLDKGVPASAATVDGTSRVVFEVAEIIPPGEAKAEDKTKLTDEISRQMRTDVVAQYVAALRNRQGVQVNQALIDQTVGIVPDAN